MATQLKMIFKLQCISFYTYRGFSYGFSNSKVDKEYSKAELGGLKLMISSNEFQLYLFTINLARDGIIP